MALWPCGLLQSATTCAYVIIVLFPLPFLVHMPTTPSLPPPFPGLPPSLPPSLPCLCPVHIVRQLPPEEATLTNDYVRFVFDNAATMNTALLQCQSLRYAEHNDLLGPKFNDEVTVVCVTTGPWSLQ